MRRTIFWIVVVLAGACLMACDSNVEQRPDSGLLFYDGSGGVDSNRPDSGVVDSTSDDVSAADGRRPDVAGFDRAAVDARVTDVRIADTAPDVLASDTHLADSVRGDTALLDHNSRVDSDNRDGGFSDLGHSDLVSGDLITGDLVSGDLVSGDLAVADLVQTVDAGPRYDSGPVQDAGDPVLASFQIQAIRDAEIGLLQPALPVEGALVTYVRPAISGITPGFYLQAEKFGPAIFFAVDPQNLSPQPQVGDRVSLLAGSTMQLESPSVVQISDYIRQSSGNDVEHLRQNVSAAVDLVSAVGSYDGELIAIEAAIAGPFSMAHEVYRTASIDTEAIVGQADLMLRTVASVQDSLQLAIGDSVGVYGVLSRRGSQAMVSAWRLEDFRPRVVRAGAADQTTVRVQFSAEINPATVANAYFAFDPPLSTHSTLVDGAWVTLQTDALTPGVRYRLTVNASVQSTSGVELHPQGNTALVLFQELRLVINEVDYDQTGVDGEEYVEIKNVGFDSVDLTLAGVELVMYNGNPERPAAYRRINLAAGGQLAPGGYLVFASPNVSVNPNATVVLFLDSEGFVKFDNNVENGAPGGDGLALYDVFSRSLVDALSYEGEITALIDGESYNLVEGVATPLEDDNSNSSRALCRLPDGVDSNNALDDWAICSLLTPGSANSAQ